MSMQQKKLTFVDYTIVLGVIICCSLMVWGMDTRHAQVAQQIYEELFKDDENAELLCEQRLMRKWRSAGIEVTSIEDVVGASDICRCAPWGLKDIIYNRSGVSMSRAQRLLDEDIDIYLHNAELDCDRIRAEYAKKMSKVAIRKVYYDYNRPKILEDIENNLRKNSEESLNERVLLRKNIYHTCITNAIGANKGGGYNGRAKKAYQQFSSLCNCVATETTDIVTGSVDAKTLQAVYNGALKRCQ